MTTSTDHLDPPLPPSPPAGRRLLRRSRTDRVGAGVAGGLGEYFSVDPVLFRVLFATAAFFGGAGVLAYLLAWVAIPEQGTVNAPIDRFVGELRRRRVPVWIVAIVAGLLLWAVAFSWWAPGPFFPVMVVVIILVAIFGRRGRRSRAEDNLEATDGVSLDKDDPAAAAVADTTRARWAGETRQWMTEARAASRLRRRRAFPVRIAALIALVVTLGVLAAIDAGTGIALPVYFWVILGIVVVALVVGMALRRTPWSLATLLVPSIAGLVAFGGTSAQLHDGFGQRDWTPAAATDLQSQYRLAFGEGVLDLRHITIDSARTIHITMAAGRVRLILPPTMNATVDANVHFGVVTVDGQDGTGDAAPTSTGRSCHRPRRPARPSRSTCMLPTATSRSTTAELALATSGPAWGGKVSCGGTFSPHIHISRMVRPCR
jgi:phage shock protein PspC (stress-responsive transcriptional regulator)/predicted membrane protein